MYYVTIENSALHHPSTYYDKVLNRTRNYNGRSAFEYIDNSTKILLKWEISIPAWIITAQCSRLYTSGQQKCIIFHFAWLSWTSFPDLYTLEHCHIVCNFKSIVTFP